MKLNEVKDAPAGATHVDPCAVIINNVSFTISLMLLAYILAQNTTTRCTSMTTDESEGVTMCIFTTDALLTCKQQETITRILLLFLVIFQGRILHYASFKALFTECVQIGNTIRQLATSSSMYIEEQHIAS